MGTWRTGSWWESEKAIIRAAGVSPSEYSSEAMTSFANNAALSLSRMYIRSFHSPSASRKWPRDRVQPQTLLHVTSQFIA